MWKTHTDRKWGYGKRYANGNDEKVVVAIRISNKPDFKTKATKKDKGQCIIIKKSILEEDLHSLTYIHPI